MTGAEHLLLLLAAHFLLGGCQSQTVDLLPNLRQIYTGDLFYLRCNDDVSEVKWFCDNKILPSKDKFLKIPAAGSKHSGTYHCETKRNSYESISINVLDYYPTASLILRTGHPVEETGNSVILRLDNEESLQGWQCFVYRGSKTWKIELILPNNSVNFLDFQPRRLNVPETIFWCTNSDQSQRSNQVTIRTSDKKVLMQMYFAPGIVGEALTLNCLNLYSENISDVMFYKNGNILLTSTSPTHTIGSVAEADQGAYKCRVTFTNSNQLDSDLQELFIQEAVTRAVVSGLFRLSCSCPRCNSMTTYIWFKITEDSQPEKLQGHNQDFMIPEESGTYACVAKWDSGRTLISKSFFYNPKKIISVIITVIGCVVILVMVICLVIIKVNRRRSHTGKTYEEVKLQSQEDRYERLQKVDGQKESEYDTINPAEVGGVKKEGDYQALAKAGMADSLYETLGMEKGQSSAAAGGYEALQKRKNEEEIYHTIGMEGAVGVGQK